MSELYLIGGATLEGIANAIRSATGGSAAYKPSQMISKISNSLYKPVVVEVVIHNTLDVNAFFRSRLGDQEIVSPGETKTLLFEVGFPYYGGANTKASLSLPNGIVSYSAKVRDTQSVWILEVTDAEAATGQVLEFT